MKKLSFLIPLLAALHFAASAQSLFLSLDANKGLNGTTWQDQSGMNNHITLSHATNVNQDGVYFDGANDAMLSTPIPMNDFTVYMTVKMEVLGKTLLGNGSPSRYGFHYPENVIYTAIDPEFSSFSSNAIVTNQQMVLTLARSNGNIALYMNGNLINTFPSNKTSTFTLTNLMGETGYQFKGWMKNISIYNVAHDAARIKILAAITPSIKLNPNPLKITITDINVSILDKNQQIKVQPKRDTSFADPKLSDDCTANEKLFNERIVFYARTVASTPAFADLLRRRMQANYVQCDKDPYYGSNFEVQYQQVLAACRAPKSIKINCKGGRADGNASAGIGNYDLNKVPELSWGGWLAGIAECAAKNNCTWNEPFPWPYSQGADIIWHELMHQYGYGHGEAPNETAKSDCRIPDSNKSWHFQSNTIPYIVGQCVREVIDNSQIVCGGIKSCPSTNQIKLVDIVGRTACSCVGDPINSSLLQDMINNASSGATLNVPAGRYEMIKPTKITKKLILKSVGGSVTTY